MTGEYLMVPTGPFTLSLPFFDDGLHDVASLHKLADLRFISVKP